MLNFIYKHSIFVVIFSLIINFNLISYSKTTDNNIYKIQTNFTQELSVKSDSENIELAQKNIFNLNQAIFGWSVSIVSYPIVVVILAFIFAFIGFLLKLDLSNKEQEIAKPTLIITMLSFAFTNSLMTYLIGKDKKIVHLD